jgi:hypothetical protein
MTVKIAVYWVVEPFSFVNEYQSFGGNFCSHLQGRRWMQQVSPRRCYLLNYTSSHPTIILDSITENKKT